MSGKRRAYRYEVIETWGTGEKAVGESPYVLDWKPLGSEYTWTIYSPGKGVTGTITGRFVDKGYADAEGYKSDDELAAVRVSVPAKEETP